METELTTLPASVKTRLDELVSSLQASFAEDLNAILVYGSAARGGYRADESDVDVMVVLNEDPQAKLEAVGPALQLARFSARIEVMVLRLDEIARASDCFPLLYDDIARCSVVLYGKSPFAGLTIHSEHKRLRIEQELREARIRLRRVVSDMATEPSFGRALERKVKQVRGSLWALLDLRGERVDDHLESVLEAAARVYAIDVGPLAGAKAREAPKPAYQALVALLEAALADVDAREAKP